jgi:hypothetical protein
MKKSRWKREALCNKIRLWQSDPENREFVFVEPRAKIEAYLEDRGVSAGMLAQRLRNLARWYAAAGVIDAENGKELEFLTNMHRAHRCDWIGMAMLAHASDAYPLEARAVLAANDAAYALARAVAIGCLSDARAMFALLKTRLRTSLYGMEQTRLAPFVLGVAADWLNEDLSFGGLNIVEEPAYRTLATMWKSQDLPGLRDALLDACELHIARSGDHTNKETFEFWEQTSQIYAAEVLLIPGLRQALGLPSPSVEHQLLVGALGRIAEVPPVEDDELLRALSLKVGQQLPELVL